MCVPRMLISIRIISLASQAQTVANLKACLKANPNKHRLRVLSPGAEVTTPSFKAKVDLGWKCLQEDEGRARPSQRTFAAGDSFCSSHHLPAARSSARLCPAFVPRAKRTV